MTVGQRIRELRDATGLTQKELGSMVNVSPQVISNWEREYTPTIDHENITRLAVALKTTADYLLTGKDMGNNRYYIYDGKTYDLEELIDKGEVITIDGQPVSNEERGRLKEHIKVAIRTIREHKKSQA